MSMVEEKSASAEHSAEDARKLAEGVREKRWKGAAFIRDLFMGKFRLGLLDPYPDPEEFIREPAREFLAEMSEFLTTKVDPDQTDHPAVSMNELRCPHGLVVYAAGSAESTPEHD